MTLKELLSKDISPKFTSLSADYNKRRIEQILKERRDNNILIYIFNMTYREWIDIFTLKKSIKTNKNISEEICQAIEKNMPKIADLLINILIKENDSDFLFNFIFYLYNYEKWFFLKEIEEVKVINLIYFLNIIFKQCI